MRFAELSSELPIVRSLATEQQQLVLDGAPLREDMLDISRTLGSYGIVGETAITLAPTDSATKLRGALQMEAERSVRAAIEACAEPVRMKLRNADGSDKHTRWFWLTADGDLRVSVHWGKRRDGADHFLWRQRRRAPPKQCVVRSIGGDFAEPAAGA